MAGRTPLCKLRPVIEKAKRRSVEKGEWFKGTDDSEWQAVYEVGASIQSGHHIAWVCKCKCGQVKTIRADFLIGGKATCPYLEQE